jgi:hypothetical protein
MSRRVLSALFLGICAFTLNFTFARGGSVSDFDAGDEGWKVVSFENLTSDNFAIIATYNPTFHPTGGNPGGYISTADQDNGDLTFSAPGKFLGNGSGATGLSYDLIYPVGAINRIDRDPGPGQRAARWRVSRRPRAKHPDDVDHRRYHGRDVPAKTQKS